MPPRATKQTQPYRKLRRPGQPSRNQGPALQAMKAGKPKWFNNPQDASRTAARRKTLPTPEAVARTVSAGQQPISPATGQPSTPPAAPTQAEARTAAAASLPDAKFGGRATGSVSGARTTENTNPGQRTYLPIRRRRRKNAFRRVLRKRGRR